MSPIHLAFTLVLFFSSVSYPSESPSIPKQKTIKETRNVDSDTGMVSVFRGTNDPSQPLTIEESIIKDSWIVQLKAKPIIAYKADAQEQLKKVAAKGVKNKNS